MNNEQNSIFRTFLQTNSSQNGINFIISLKIAYHKVKDTGIVLEIRKNMDLFCKSMDSYWFVGHKSGLKKIWFVSWITNPDFKRFGSYRDHKSSQFWKDSTCFHESKKSLRILSTMAQNESLKIEIREFESLRILKLWICKSGFANPNLKDSYRGFVLEKKNSQNTRFVFFWKDL